MNILDSKINGSELLQSIVDIYEDEEFLKADGFDDAVIGVDEQSMRLIYSVSKCIQILTKNEGMSKEDAWDYFEYNIEGSYVGIKTPIWCHDEF